MFGFLFKKGRKRPTEVPADAFRVDLNDAVPAAPPREHDSSERHPRHASPSEMDPPMANPSALTQVPSALKVGLEMRAVPEKHPGTPKAWNIRITKIDQEGIWLMRTADETTPLPVQPREILSLVVFDEAKQLTFDCPVIRIKPGRPEAILVAAPTKTLSENSKLASVGSRKHYRITFRIPCEVRLPGHPLTAPPIRCHTRDISQGGLALDTTRNFQEGSEVDVRILSLSFPLQLRCKVVRCFEIEPGEQVVALAYPENMSSITKELISHFILENQRGR